jgi:pilus assembly protein CpaE
MTTPAVTAPIEVVILAPAGSLEQPWITGLQADPGVKVEACVGVLNRAVEVVGQLQPNVLIIDRSVSETEEVIHAAYAASPHTLCFAILQEEDMASMRRLVAAGARDILVKPLQLADLLSSMQQGMQVEESRRQRAGLPSLRSNRQQVTPGKVIVVMGPKGGVGTTTIATNVAVALKLVTGKGVALADFNLQFGDVAVLLNLWSKHTLHDLALHYQEIDDALIQRVMVPHSSGVQVLQAPSLPDMAADIGAEEVMAVVKALQSRFAYVVIDCWSFLDEITEALIVNADQVLLVTTPEVPALKNTKQALEYFTRHGTHHEHVALVLNRFPSVKGVTLHDIQEHIRHPIQANLPSDGPAVTFAANKGVPVVQSHPESWVAQSFLRLAAWVAGDKVETISHAPVTRTLASATATPQRSKRLFGLIKSST